MNMHLVETSKGRFLFVGIPKGAKNFVWLFKDVLEFSHKDGKVDFVPLEAGIDTEMICLYSKATEEDAKKIVDPVYNYFVDYSRDDFSQDWVGITTTAKKSLNSLTERCGIYTKNSLVKKPALNFPARSNGVVRKHFEDKLSKWMKAQEKVSPDYVILKVRYENK